MIEIKKCGILLLATLITTGCNSQENKNKEETDNKQEVSADAPKGSWKVNREFDEEGNLIRYDSIYSWSSGDDLDRLSSLDRDSTLQAMQSKFYRNFSSFGNQGFDDVFSSDSLFTQRFFDDAFFTSQFGEDFMDIEKVHKQMEAMQKKFLEKYRSEFKEPEEGNSKNNK
ncbi:hypothetical protein ACFLR9_04015 [Bacteroidota bacterium]|jgi:hypothetical protein